MELLIWHCCSFSRPDHDLEWGDIIGSLLYSESCSHTNGRNLEFIVNAFIVAHLVAHLVAHYPDFLELWNYGEYFF